MQSLKFRPSLKFSSIAIEHTITLMDTLNHGNVRMYVYTYVHKHVVIAVNRPYRGNCCLEHYLRIAVNCRLDAPQKEL